MTKGDVTVYEDGTYAPVLARGTSQVMLYRLRQMKMIIWAAEHHPTPEVLAVKGWIDRMMK